jgi:hypothetical protein
MRLSATTRPRLQYRLAANTIGKAIASAGSGLPSGEVVGLVDHSRVDEVLGEGLPVYRVRGGYQLLRLSGSDTICYLLNRSGIHLVNIYLNGRNVMHAVMRDYSGVGAKKLFDVLEKKTAEVENIIKPIKGFVSYSLIRTARGGFSITICEDKAGTDESIRAARDWIANNAREARASAPKVSEGAVILHLK